MLQEAINEVSKIISKRKEEYHYHLASKLNNLSTSAKTYWSILKTFYNGKKYHLFLHFKLAAPLSQILRRKQTFFNKFFASQCFPFKTMTVTFSIVKGI